MLAAATVYYFLCYIFVFVSVYHIPLPKKKSTNPVSTFKIRFFFADLLFSDKKES